MAILDTIMPIVIIFAVIFAIYVKFKNPLNKFFVWVYEKMQAKKEVLTSQDYELAFKYGG
jgi:hypothetical protein